MSAPVILPARVILPAVTAVDGLTLRIALGNASRAVLSVWRREYGFPASTQGRKTYWTRTADVAAWCEAHGAAVTFV